MEERGLEGWGRQEGGEGWGRKSERMGSEGGGGGCRSRLGVEEGVVFGEWGRGCLRVLGKVSVGIVVEGLDGQRVRFVWKREGKGGGGKWG